MRNDKRYIDLINALAELTLEYVEKETEEFNAEGDGVDFVNVGDLWLEMAHGEGYFAFTEDVVDRVEEILSAAPARAAARPGAGQASPDADI